MRKTGLDVGPGPRTARWSRSSPTRDMDCPVLSERPASEQRRWELLYAIQRRDARGGRINPGVIRKVVRIVQAVGSLALMGAEEFHREVGRRYDTNLRAHLLEFGQIWRLARYDMVGHQPEDQLVWDLSDIGFIGANQPSRKTIDFGVITQPWLRDLTMAWARE